MENSEERSMLHMLYGCKKGFKEAMESEEGRKELIALAAYFNLKVEQVLFRYDT